MGIMVQPFCIIIEKITIRKFIKIKHQNSRDVDILVNLIQVSTL